MSTRTRAAAARSTPALRTAARLGHAVNGVLNLMIGALALGVVGSGASGTADPNGALTGLAQAPGGQVLIWVIVVGLAALGVWQFVAVPQEVSTDRRRRGAARAKLIGKGIAYLALAAIGIRVALHSAGGGSEEDLTARLLGAPGGAVVVGLVGLAAAAIGAYLVVKGVRRTFLDDLDLPGGPVARVVTVLGVAGYVARGIAFVAIGGLFLAAAFTHDPAQAGGLDDALAALAALPLGAVLLVGIAVGFLAFGVYGVARARFARL